MRKITLAVLISTFVVSTCPAQKAIRVKYEVGVEKSFYSFENPQKNVTLLNDRQAYFGFTISHLLKKNFHIETGLYSKYYGTDLYSTTPDTSNLVFADNRLQIPFRLLYKNRLVSDKLIYSINVGASALIRHSYHGIRSPHQLNLLEIKDPPNVFALFELGAGLEYELGKHFTAGFNYRYYFSTGTQFSYWIKEQRNNNSLTDYFIKSRAGFNSYTVSVGYCFK